MKNPKAHQSRRHFLHTASAATALALSNSSAMAASPAVEQLTQRLNPKIADYRSAALETLKPTDRDLQHGLELHADAIVFDSYGFSPRAAVGGDAIQAAIEACRHFGPEPEPANLRDARSDLSNEHLHRVSAAARARV